MRETRQSGSVGGMAQLNAPSLPQSCLTMGPVPWLTMAFPFSLGVTQGIGAPPPRVSLHHPRNRGATAPRTHSFSDWGRWRPHSLGKIGTRVGAREAILEHGRRDVTRFPWSARFHLSGSYLRHRSPNARAPSTRGIYLPVIRAFEFPPKPRAAVSFATPAA